MSTFEIDNSADNYRKHERDHKQVRIERRFREMDRQIGELTSLLRTLTERISSNNREEKAATLHKIDLQAILTHYIFTDSV